MFISVYILCKMYLLYLAVLYLIFEQGLAFTKASNHRIAYYSYI